MDIVDINRITRDYPRFDDGRIDYTNEKVCFVLNCVVIYGDEILMTKRSADVIAYPNTLNGVSGFIDRTDLDIEELAKNELREELNAPIEKIIKFKISQPFIQIDESINREWHVFAVLAEFSEQFIPKINWENKSAEWFKIDDLKTMSLMPGFKETLDIALSLR